MSAEREQSIVLLSGGLDSVVSLACACEVHHVLLALTFRYGQKAAMMEIEAAGMCAAHFHVPHQVLDLDWMRTWAKSSLIERSLEVPQVSLNDLERENDAEEAARQVWVPNRNGLFVNVAAVLAESLGASMLVTGFNAEEARTFPDNSPQFVAAVNRSLEFSTRNGVRVVSFTQHLEKAAIVRWGVDKKVPFHLLYSCYVGGDLMCGRCESCQRLKRAFMTTGNWDMVRARFSQEA